MARDGQGRQMVGRGRERQLRGLRRAAPLQQRSRRRPHVLPTLPRRICERRRKRDQHHPQAALPLLIRSTIWAADLAPSGPPPPFSVEEVDRSRTPVLAAAMGEEGDLAAIRFARGCRCYVVWIEGAVAGYGWLSTGPEWIGELQLEIKPREREGYIWNCVTLAEHRRRGVFRSLVAGISEHARNGGLKRLWIGSVAIPAERAVELSGFRPALQ